MSLASKANQSVNCSNPHDARDYCKSSTDDGTDDLEEAILMEETGSCVTRGLAACETCHIIDEAHKSLGCCY